MGQLAATTFGIGTPTINPFFQNPWSTSPYGFSMTPPLSYFPQQLIQAVPQQLQQIQYLQQQQLQILQQLLQFVPAQLQQLQQLIQFVPHQIQQSQPSQQWQPFGPPLSGPLGFSLSPQAYLGQPASHVM